MASILWRDSILNVKFWYRNFCKINSSFILVFSVSTISEVQLYFVILILNQIIACTTSYTTDCTTLFYIDNFKCILFFSRHFLKREKISIVKIWLENVPLFSSHFLFTLAWILNDFYHPSENKILLPILLHRQGLFPTLVEFLSKNCWDGEDTEERRNQLLLTFCRRWAFLTYPSYPLEIAVLLFRAPNPIIKSHRRQPPPPPPPPPPPLPLRNEYKKYTANPLPFPLGASSLRLAFLLSLSGALSLSITVKERDRGASRVAIYHTHIRAHESRLPTVCVCALLPPPCCLSVSPASSQLLLLLQLLQAEPANENTTAAALPNAHTCSPAAVFSRRFDSLALSLWQP